MQEFEKKLMLTEEQYKYLREFACRNVPGTFQTNYYFDTEDFSMNRRGITCRVRQKNGIYKATIKNHSMEKFDCSIEEDFAEKNYFDLNAFAFIGAQLQGDLVTERIVMMKETGCEMVLDRNIYLGTVDYEMETEYLLGFEERAESMLSKVIQVLLSQGFDVRRDDMQGKSKSERFFERKENQRR